MLDVITAPPLFAKRAPPVDRRPHDARSGAQGAFVTASSPWSRWFPARRHLRLFQSPPWLRPSRRSPPPSSCPTPCRPPRRSSRPPPWPRPSRRSPPPSSCPRGSSHSSRYLPSIVGSRTRARAGKRPAPAPPARRRSLPGEDHQLRPPVPGLPFRRVVGRDGFVLPESRGRNPLRGDSGLDEPVADRVRARDRQLPVLSRVAGVVGVTLERHRDRGIRLHDGRELGHRRDRVGG